MSRVRGPGDPPVGVGAAVLVIRLNAALGRSFVTRVRVRHPQFVRCDGRHALTADSYSQFCAQFRMAPDTPDPLVPGWLLICFFCTVVCGGIFANLFLARAAFKQMQLRRATRRGDPPWWDSGGWWMLLGQLALTDALLLSLVSGGELWSLREIGGPWRWLRTTCSLFLGMEAALNVAQTYLLVALTLQARATPADNVPDVSIWRTGSGVVPSALVWMLATAVAVPRTFLGVWISPRPNLPLCTIMPSSLSTGALVGPLDGTQDPWEVLGPVLSSLVLCAVPATLLTFTSVPVLFSSLARRLHPKSLTPAGPCPPHKLARIEWINVTASLSLTWLALSFPRLLSATVHGLLPPPTDSTAFRIPPLGSRALPDTALLAVSMLHYALTAARPIIVVISGPSMRRTLLEQSLQQASNPNQEVDLC